MTYKKLYFRMVILIFACMITTISCSRSTEYSAQLMSVPNSQLMTAPRPEPMPDVSGFTSRTKQTGEYFGTISILRLYDDFTADKNDERFERVWAETKALLKEVENAISVSVDTSDIARFNALSYGESITVTAHTANMLITIRELYEETNGRYDPTVYPLVDLWGFTPRFQSKSYSPALPYDRPRGKTGFPLPDSKYIKAFLQLVDFSGIVLAGSEASGYTLTKMIPSVTVDGVVYQARLDLGGIGKGYVSDLVRELLVKSGYRFGYFSCGSSSMSMLKGMTKASLADGTYLFDLDIRKPRQTENNKSSYITLRANETSLSTSGDYDRAYILENTRYCHIIDPDTGYPINTQHGGGMQKGIATATILGGSAAYSDGLSTALCAMPFADALKFIDSRLREHRIVLVVYSGDQNIYEIVTNMSAEDIIINDAAYAIASRLDNKGNIQYTGKLLDY